ncbi:MAG: hypothetical protein J6Y48_07005, partial [Clostridia bacterium]|nr:hypothetical protein [Clostridia bacterium]
NIDDSLAAGAHALFMPHGIGHALGLDAHDMENFGDDVGYAPGTKRSSQFGLNALRLARQCAEFLRQLHHTAADQQVFTVPEYFTIHLHLFKHASAPPVLSQQPFTSTAMIIPNLISEF